VGVPKFSQLGLPRLWGPITLRANLWLRGGLKKSHSPHQELSNNMLHATCMQGNRVNSLLLVVGSQTTNLTPGPSFGHNLCFRFPNGSCEPILAICVPRYFQCYKELLNLLGFDPCNRSLKIWESTRIPTPKVGAPLECEVPSHFLTLPRAWDVTPRLPLGPPPLQALALVVSPRLGCDRKPLPHSTY
jgi:hypothetical protein